MENISKTDLIYSLKELTLGLKREWRVLAKKGQPTRDELVAFRDGALVPLLEKITIFAGNAVIYEKNNDLDEAIKLIASIYQSAAENERFGIVGSEEHLSWTLPSKLAMEYLYVIGGVATKYRNFYALNALLSHRIEYPNKTYYQNVAGTNVLIFRLPYYNHQSGEGDLRVYFDEATKLVSENSVFITWFNDEAEEATTALVEFDFLRSFYLYLNSDRNWIFPNFRRFYTFRVIPIIRNMLTNDGYKKIYGPDIKEKLKEYLESVDNIRSNFFDGWGVGDWRSIKELQ